MRRVLALGTAIIFVGFVGIASAQMQQTERLQSNQSGMGVGTGIGDISGNTTRVSTFDRTQFLDRLSQQETVFGRIIGLDLPGKKLYLEGGGSSHDEGRAGGGAMNYRTVYLDEYTNMEQVRVLQAGDDVTIQANEEVSKDQPFGTGKKLVREIMVLRINERLAGFGGLGQRPNPATERAIETNGGGITGGIAGSVLPGQIVSGVTTSVGEYTGAAPCWQCEPQPGYGNAVGQSHFSNKSDYGTDLEKLNLNKGLN